MESLNGTIDYLLLLVGDRLLYPLLVNQRIFVVYLLTGFLIAYLVFRARNSSLGLGAALKRFFAYAFPKKIYTHPSAKTDYIFFLINGIVFPLFAGPFIFGGLAVAVFFSGTLETVFGVIENPIPITLTVTAIATLVFVLLMDIGVFLGHYFQHRIPLLWEFHKVHHSAEVLTPMTVYRMHPLDDILAGSLSGLFVGIGNGVFVYFFGDRADFITVGGINVVIFIFYVVGYNLRHTHIWVNYPAAISNVFISPAQHQIHHSRLPEHHDRNFGLVFAIWDKLAGTLYVPKSKEEIEYGIDTEDQAYFNSARALYFRPFIGAWNIIKSSGIGSFVNRKTPSAAAALFIFIVLMAGIPFAARPLMALGVDDHDDVYLENLTWTEVSTKLDKGVRTIIIPTGGTEQNGPHVILGKHNYIIEYTAGEIAREVGDALVAPVMAYVPEGDIAKREGHMRYAGTISTPEPVFEEVLTAAAQSFKTHGFTTIAFVGDSGGNQDSQKRVADRLTEQWQADGVRVVHLGDYYFENGQTSFLKDAGESEITIGKHAGIRDTSELLYVFADGVREERLRRFDNLAHDRLGAHGDATKASAERGEKLLRLKIEAAVAQLKKELARP